MPMMIKTGIGGMKEIWKSNINLNLNFRRISETFLKIFYKNFWTFIQFCHLALANVVLDALQGCTLLLGLEEAGQGEPLQLHAEELPQLILREVLWVGKHEQTCPERPLTYMRYKYIWHINMRT